MKLEKRSADIPQPSQPAETPHDYKKRSHILVYILILFIAAFLLMTLSFLSHQRSNEQVLGQLSINLNSLTKFQSALAENVRLQEQIDVQKLQLEALEKELDSAQSSAGQLTDEIASLQKELDQLRQTTAAVDALTQLQQMLLSGDTAACRRIISDMEATGLDKLLPAAAATPGGLSPQQMYQQVKLLTTVPAEG